MISSRICWTSWQHWNLISSEYYCFIECWNEVSCNTMQALLNYKISLTHDSLWRLLSVYNFPCRMQNLNLMNLEIVSEFILVEICFFFKILIKIKRNKWFCGTDKKLNHNIQGTGQDQNYDVSYLLSFVYEETESLTHFFFTLNYDNSRRPTKEGKTLLR